MNAKQQKTTIHWQKEVQFENLTIRYIRPHLDKLAEPDDVKELRQLYVDISKGLSFRHRSSRPSLATKLIFQGGGGLITSCENRASSRGVLAFRTPRQ